MSAKEHYDNHLGNIYSWMIGDLESKTTEFKNLLLTNQIRPEQTRAAIDLGAGNGVQSFAMKELGFQVTAIDFNEQLLNELRESDNADGIDIIQSDIREINGFKNLEPELIICCGDTITHLESKHQIAQLIKDATEILRDEGRLILTFRDYSTELDDRQRFIPVKSSDDRILTCILEYQKDKVVVNDLLHERKGGKWEQKISSYEKVRISTDEISTYVKKASMNIELNERINGMQTLIAKK